MKINKILLGQIFSTATEIFIGLWILCLAWFVFAVIVATSGFQKQFTDTTFGKSNSYSIFMLSLIATGTVAFILGVSSVLIKRMIILNHSYEKVVKNRLRSFGLRLLSLIVAFVLGIFFLQIVYKNEPIILSNSKIKNLLSDYYPTSTPRVELITIDELVKLTNNERIKAGLQSLTRNLLLDKAAELKADDMVTRNYWSHNAPDGTEPWIFIRKSGYRYIYAGENLARGYNTSSEVVDNWMVSSEHKKNILGPNYTDVGFAYKKGEYIGEMTNLIVQMFASPDNYNNVPATNANSTNYKQNTSLDVTTVRNYMLQTIAVKSSWEKANERVSKAELDTLLDSFARQIQFCQTIISNIESGKGLSTDDVVLWNAVIKMGNETAVLS